MTLASVLIAAGRVGERLQVADVCEQLQMSPQELREDVSVLNVVNFGGGAYVIYAEVLPTGEIEVDPEPYSDTFDRPARLLPIEAKALVAAIDLIGLAQPDLRSAREKVVDALGFDPSRRACRSSRPRSRTPSRTRVELAVARAAGCSSSSTGRRPRTATPSAWSSPTRCFNGTEAWYVAAWDLERGRLRHFRLDRIKRAVGARRALRARARGSNPIADIGGWPRTGTVGGSRVARVLIRAEQARWAREQRTVLAELPEGRDHRRDHVQGHRVPRPRGA